jgi:hypothetical protein
MVTVGSNPIRGMDVCVRLFCVRVVLYVGNGLSMAKVQQMTIEE